MRKKLIITVLLNLGILLFFSEITNAYTNYHFTWTVRLTGNERWKERITDNCDGTKAICKRQICETKYKEICIGSGFAHFDKEYQSACAY